ncbi:glutamate--cysteine ligase [Tanacetum coccineum]
MQEEGTSEEPEDVDELTQKVAMKGKGKGITHKETCSTSRRLSNNIPKVRLKRYLKMRGAHGGPWRRLCALPALWVGVMGTKEHMRLTIEVYHNLKCDFDIVGNESIGAEVDKILTELLDELNIDEYEIKFIDDKGLDTEAA